MEERAFGVGELIGASCVDAEATELGRVVYVERDRAGRPRWFDVRFTDTFLDDHRWSFARVRMGADRIAAWDADARVVTLDRPVEELSVRWFPVHPDGSDAAGAEGAGGGVEDVVSADL